MSSDSERPDSPSSAKYIDPNRVASELIRRQTLDNLKGAEPTGTFGSTSDMLPDDLAEDVEAEEHQAPPSQSPRDQMRSKDFRHRARTALDYYGEDITAVSKDPSVAEDAMIALMDHKGDSEDEDENEADTESEEVNDDEELSS